MLYMEKKGTLSVTVGEGIALMTTALLGLPTGMVLKNPIINSIETNNILESVLQSNSAIPIATALLATAGVYAYQRVSR